MSWFTKGGGAFVHDGECVAYSPLDTQCYFVVLMGWLKFACFWNHLLEDHPVASPNPTTLTSVMNDATTIFSMPFFISKATNTKSI